MRISYQMICDFWLRNRKLLIVYQMISLLLSGIYLTITPKTYEAYFQVRTAKVLMDGNWTVLKLARNTRRDLMSPQGFPVEIVNACMEGNSHSLRRSLVNAMQIDVIDDFGGVMGVAVRLVGISHAKECANLLANYIVDNSNNALSKRLDDEGFVAGSATGRIRAFEKPMVTSQVQMSDSYVKPRITNVLIIATLAGFFVALAHAILRKRYCGA